MVEQSQEPVPKEQEAVPAEEGKRSVMETILFYLVPHVA